MPGLGKSGTSRISFLRSVDTSSFIPRLSSRRLGAWPLTRLKRELNLGAVPVEQFGCFAWLEPGGGGEGGSHGVALGPVTWRWVARRGHFPVSPPCHPTPSHRAEGH